MTLPYILASFYL